MIIRAPYYSTVVKPDKPRFADSIFTGHVRVALEVFSLFPTSTVQYCTVLVYNLGTYVILVETYVPIGVTNLGFYYTTVLYSIRYSTGRKGSGNPTRGEEYEWSMKKKSLNVSDAPAPVCTRTKSKDSIPYSRTPYGSYACTVLYSYSMIP